jgi:multimeric flavodoxin WrbA
MKKVVAFVGSGRKRHTQAAVEHFLDGLRALGDVECEIVRLGEQHLETCRGCSLCLDRGEELCPLKDDRDLLIGKMSAADGVVFATPNYAFQVSGLTKVFIDRLGFLFHRPRFFGKTFTGIVVQGIYGGGRIVQYLDFVGWALGFNLVGGSCITTLEPMTERQRRRNDAMLAAQAGRFHRRLAGPAFPTPTLRELMIFRMSRTSRKLMLDDTWRDYTYFREQGWFESNYYYPVSLNPVKRLAGNLFDRLAARFARGRETNSAS